MVAKEKSIDAPIPLAGVPDVVFLTSKTGVTELSAAGMPINKAPNPSSDLACIAVPVVASAAKELPEVEDVDKGLTEATEVIIARLLISASITVSSKRVPPSCILVEVVAVNPLSAVIATPDDV